jgi:hypothetical protein
MRMRLIIGLLVLLAACDNVPATPTETPTLTGPTLAPTEVFRPDIQALDPAATRSIGQNDLTAASVPSGGELPPLAIGTPNPDAMFSTVQITAADGALLIGDLYPNPANQRVPGVLLIAPDRTAWLDLPLRLQAAGYTALAMDLPVGAALTDFEAMIRALSETGTVDPGRIAVVGAESGADLALTGCANNLLCDAAALFSPVQQAAVRAATFGFNPRPLFLSAGSGDASASVVESIRTVATGTVVLETVSGSRRGAALIGVQPDLVDRLIAFLDEQLPPIQ